LTKPGVLLGLGQQTVNWNLKGARFSIPMPLRKFRIALSNEAFEELLKTFQSEFAIQLGLW